jgi:hypothetical protein
LRNRRPRFFILLAFLLLLLPLPAQAALTPVGAPLAIADESPCSTDQTLEVIATPKGAFEVVWVDDFDFVVKGRRFARNLQPSGPPRTLLPLHGGLFFSELAGIWAGRYELAMNALDFGNNPGDPVTAYRVQLDLEGDPLAPPARVKPPRFLGLAPAAGGDSLQFRFEPPIFGGPGPCQSWGLLARRVDRSGAPLSAESRVNSRASAPALGPLSEVDRLPDDTFVVAYGTCHKFTGVVVRRLNAAGAPVGKPIDLPLPDQPTALALAARGGADLAVAARPSRPSAGAVGVYTWAVVNGQVFGPTHISAPPGASNALLVDLAASPAGGYLLLFRDRDAEPITLFAQELDARGVPRGAPLAITGEGESGATGAIASLPNGRWLVVTRAQSGEGDACRERLVGIVLAGG